MLTYAAGELAERDTRQQDAQAKQRQTDEQRIRDDKARARIVAPPRASPPPPRPPSFTPPLLDSAQAAAAAAAARKQQQQPPQQHPAESAESDAEEEEEGGGGGAVWVGMRGRCVKGCVNGYAGVHHAACANREHGAVCFTISCTICFAASFTSSYMEELVGRSASRCVCPPRARCCLLYF
jgi:hypothetical protein